MPTISARQHEQLETRYPDPHNGKTKWSRYSAKEYKGRQGLDREYEKYLVRTRRRLRFVTHFLGYRTWRSAQLSIGFSPVGVDTTVRDRFKELSSRWRNETRLMSSTTDRVLHPSYQDIIGLGEPAVPLILRDLELNGGHWFWALRHITGQNPVPPQYAGNVTKMRESWLQWGREHNYL
jgi:hypothetical protein